jgi:hypothetical protein
MISKHLYTCSKMYTVNSVNFIIFYVAFTLPTGVTTCFSGLFSMSSVMLTTISDWVCFIWTYCLHFCCLPPVFSRAFSYDREICPESLYVGVGQQVVSACSYLILSLLMLYAIQLIKYCSLLNFIFRRKLFLTIQKQSYNFICRPNMTKQIDENIFIISSDYMLCRWRLTIQLSIQEWLKFSYSFLYTLCRN